MAYVLDIGKGEDRTGETIIEAHGIAHRIVFGVDHIKDEPKIEHTTKRSAVKSGTRITVTLPMARDDGWFKKYVMDRFLELAESFAWLNPHLSLRVTWNGERKIDIKASNTKWQKWLPSWPTSPHWYDQSRLRRYMQAHIRNQPSVTVRQFISEFRGMTGTAKQKQVLAATGCSHVSLHNFFGLHKVNTNNIAKLLAALKTHTKPVSPADLGIIGKEHFYRMMEAAGGDPKTFTYNRKPYVDCGVSGMIEFAFGIHAKGLSAAGRTPSRKEITGVNWSPGINNPFRQLGRGGVSLDAILENLRASNSQPVIMVLHVAHPRVAYTDKGKTAIVVEGEVNDDDYSE
jgi:DNA topoisomerase VI subunit B